MPIHIGVTDEPGPLDPSEHFDFSTLDSLEDEIREALKHGQSVTKLVSDLVEQAAAERANEAIARVVLMIADARKPKLYADQLAWVAGMNSTEGKSIIALAEENGVSKQAFSQGALRLAKELGLKPSRGMRSLKARESMARAYRERHGMTEEVQEQAGVEDYEDRPCDESEESAIVAQ